MVPPSGLPASVPSGGAPSSPLAAASIPDGCPLSPASAEVPVVSLDPHPASARTRGDRAREARVILMIPTYHRLLEPRPVHKSSEDTRRNEIPHVLNRHFVLCRRPPRGDESTFCGVEATSDSRATRSLWSEVHLPQVKKVV